MRIGPYEVESEIGRGGMGVVLRARAPEGHVVAVKVLRSGGAPALARFDRERRLLGRANAYAETGDRARAVADLEAALATPLDEATRRSLERRVAELKK